MVHGKEVGSTRVMWRNDMEVCGENSLSGRQ